MVLAYLNTFLFYNFLGQLDTDGRAKAQLNIPIIDLFLLKSSYLLCNHL